MRCNAGYLPPVVLLWPPWIPKELVNTGNRGVNTSKNMFRSEVLVVVALQYIRVTAPRSRMKVGSWKLELLANI